MEGLLKKRLFNRCEAVQVRGLREMLQKIVGPEGAQVSAHRCETIRVRLLQVAFQRENEAGQAHLRSYRRETVQMWFLCTSVRREVPIEGTQMRGDDSRIGQTEDRTIFLRFHHADRVLSTQIYELFISFTSLKCSKKLCKYFSIIKITVN